MQVAFFTHSARLQRKTCAQVLYNTEKPISQNRYFYEIRISYQVFALKDIISHNDIIQDFLGIFKYRAENRRFVYKRTDSDVQIAILRALEGY